MFTPVSNHFRCPTNVFEGLREARLTGEPVFFRFGQELTCYGRHASGNGVSPHLVFDPAEVIDNLRLERYLGPLGEGPGFLRRLYYYVRPFTTLAMRRGIQRFHARNWEQNTFPRWPVDTSVEDLCEKLLLLAMQAAGITEVPFVWFWPRGAQAALIMTHDVETTAGRDYCGALMDLNDAFGIKASFQVVPEGRYEVTAKFLGSICQRGFDVEVQDLNHDGRLFDERQEFLRRAARINQHARQFGATGFRAAVLYRRPEWYDAFEFSFDMSMPNVAPMDPQRGGCCTVMPYFIGKVVELPVTTIQDYTLFQVLNQRSIDLWRTQMALIRKRHGLISFIVHPDYVIEADTRAVYEELLGDICSRRKDEAIWCARPAEVDAWWRTRSRLRVEKAGASWSVAGEGAERAVLAWARNVDGRLVYDVPAT
jgi:hypothetical protein